MIVIDANIFLAAVLEDESNDAAREAYQSILLGAIAVVVPYMFRYEVANAFCMSLRRKRISQAIYERFIALTAAFPVDVDDDQKIEDVSRAACQHGLTIYDASYLELAKRRGLPLSTLDKALRRAAEAENLFFAG